jgi:hypothetical protein
MPICLNVKNPRLGVLPVREPQRMVFMTVVRAELTPISRDGEAVEISFELNQQ